MQRQRKRHIITTADGSTSIYLPDMDEHYHSTHGAIIESEHIFIEKGLLAAVGIEKCRVLEVGLGTGLNVLTTLKAALNNNLKVEMHSIEAFPISENESRKLNYPELLNIDKELYYKIHTSAWDERITFNKNFSLIKYHSKLETLLSEDRFSDFEVIYFDAFAPEKQIEMWEESIFKQLYGLLNKNGVLVTYCVKGEIRRRLKRVGFEVEKLAGPKGGKREMCRAWKK